MKTAVCTLVIGERFQELFSKYSEQSFRAYARDHAYDLFVFDKPFADLPGKSFAWQKLLLLDQSALRGFNRIIWLDADIIIKRGAPALEVPPGKLGHALERPFTGDVRSWYEYFSLPPAPEVVQTGVLSLEHAHAPILRSALDYPETQMFEMPALSLQIARSGLGHRLDPRFNAVPMALMLNDVPRPMLENKLLKELLWKAHYPPLRRALRETCKKNWFIHAAGAKRDLARVHRCLEHIGT
jgi:hypothetical protein